MTISDWKASSLVQEVLCVAPPTWLNLAEEHFLMNLDFFKPVQVCPRSQLSQQTGTGPAGGGRSLFHSSGPGPLPK